MYLLIRSRLRGASLAAARLAAASAIAACAGESPTDPGEPYPYDIVFERGEGTAGASDIYYLDLETGEARRVLTVGVAGMHPAGSTVGLIAFVRTDAEFNAEIFTASLTGTGLTNVSNHSGIDLMPAWAPNGQRIAFVTDRAGYRDIFVANANGTNVRRITPADPSGVVTMEQWPAWSPTADLLAYSSTVGGSPDIWTTTVDASPPVVNLRTSGPDSDEHPTWSRQGDRIAFHRIDQNTGDADIMILTLGTGALQRISMPGQQLWAAWSPEGNLIAFSSNHEGPDFEIYTMSVDGSDVVRRTDNGLNDLRPTWVVRAGGG